MDIQITNNGSEQAPIRSALFHHMNLGRNSSSFSNTNLELANQLHSHLQLERLIESFYRLTVKGHDYSGLIYQIPDEREGLSFGILGGFSCSYQLSFNEVSLGSLDFYSSQRLSETQLGELENSLCALVNPLQNALLYRQAVLNSLRDPLTKTHNRAAFNQDMEREVTLARRFQRPLSMIVLDIDYFKRINDTLGHSYGDKVLRELVQKTQGAIRISDTLYRFGGEEFVILASHTDLKGAQELAERVRQAVFEAAIPEQGIPAISVSCGVAQFNPEECADQLFHQADAALYKAKQSGRNRVCA